MSGWGGSKFTMALDVAESEAAAEAVPVAEVDDDQVKPEVARYSTHDQSPHAEPAPRPARRGLG